ncbi:MAG: nucleoside hydrolase, partial [Candidatus Krumholzibacteria bacterium]|nr:nucleoside hydrolase [Candidatus Krumholzibacteria bacterium]
MGYRRRIAGLRLIAACVAAAALSFIAVPASGHGVAVRVIIDTDAALDDMRAIALVLFDGHFEPLAIVTSDGSSAPAAGAENVARALAFLGRPEIRVGAGRELDAPAPPWRPMSEAMGWADLPGVPADDAFEPAVGTILRALGMEAAPVIYICLGPMTNLAAALAADPSAARKIGTVYFQGTPDGPGEGSWNTARDPGAAAAVAASGVRVRYCALPDSSLLKFDAPFLEMISALDSPAAEFFRRLHADPGVMELVRAGHFKAWDETVALCLIEPMLAGFGTDRPGGGPIRLASFDLHGAENVYLQTVKYGGKAAAPRPDAVVFRGFPVDPALFRDDVASIADEIVVRHGLEEWRAAVIANELHRHLGIYSIIGVKMGIRARELMNATLDDLEVTSLASSEPPLSCMNDGLQASTGASLGRGSISVDPAGKSAGAIFM